MPIAIPNGTAAGAITTSELGGYGGATGATTNSSNQTTTVQPGGNQTPAEVALVSSVDDKLAAIVTGWVDSGGPGGHQAAVSQEILRRAAFLQGDMLASVRQWARPGRERALLEMMGVLSAAIISRDRLLLELRERLNQSPY
jgi:hypothetical protein